MAKPTTRKALRTTARDRAKNYRHTARTLNQYANEWTWLSAALSDDEPQLHTVTIKTAIIDRLNLDSPLLGEYHPTNIARYDILRHLESLDTPTGKAP